MAEVVQPAVIPYRRRSRLYRLGVIARKKPLGTIGAVILVVVFSMAFFADFITSIGPLQEDYPNRLAAPGAEFYFGSDAYGRDMFSRVVHGAQVSLKVGFGSVAIGMLFGITIGITTAYFGGKLDILVQRFMDTMMGFPGLVLALAIVTALGASLTNVIIAIAIGTIPRTARVVRSSAMSIKQEDYILASRAIGLTSQRIMLRHVFPNTFGPTLIIVTGALASAIVAEAGLSFLGLGVPPPHPSWGRMLQFAARRWMEAAPWLAIFPGLALTLTVFGFNLFGDALRDVLDPRLRGR